MSEFGGCNVMKQRRAPQENPPTGCSGLGGGIPPSSPETVGHDGIPSLPPAWPLPVWSLAWLLVGALGEGAAGHRNELG